MFKFTDKYNSTGEKHNVSDRRKALCQGNINTSERSKESRNRTEADIHKDSPDASVCELVQEPCQEISTGKRLSKKT